MFIHKKSPKKYFNESGLTFVELMIAMAISGLAISAIYMSFKAQQRAATVQDHVAGMQQTIRGTLTAFEREVRMAGYNPDDNSSMTNIEDANSTKITFQYWDETDSEIDTVSYKYDNINDTLDRKKGAGSYEAISGSISNVEFYYTLDDGTQTLSPAGSLDNIHSIQVSLLVRSRNEDPDYLNQKIYTTASGAAATNPSSPNDGYRRRQSISTIFLRNLEL